MGSVERAILTSNGREKDCQNSQKDIGTTHNDSNSADRENVVFEYSRLILSAVEMMLKKEEIRKPGTVSGATST
jgi:hypothetical protein